MRSCLSLSKFCLPQRRCVQFWFDSEQPTLTDILCMCFISLSKISQIIQAFRLHSTFRNQISTINNLTIPKLFSMDSDEPNNDSPSAQQLADRNSPQMMSPPSPTLSTFMEQILHPKSIFSITASRLGIDSYMKIKTKDKPKDTLKEIQGKKQSFISYITRPHSSPDQLSSNKQQQINNASKRVKEEYAEFTFYRNSNENSLLFVRIRPSRSNKCNISVSNMLGEIYKYYPNVFLTKREGKIAKLISENKRSFIIVLDYTQIIDSTLKSFPSMLNEARRLYYEIAEVEVEAQFLQLARAKIEEMGKGSLQYTNRKIILMSTKVHSLEVSNLLPQIFERLKGIEQQQQQFLTQFRGEKANGAVNLTFDMMSINHWRQFKRSGEELSNQIIQLFVEKENSLDSMIVDDPQSLHTPQRLRVSQNCSLCLSKTTKTKRPRRTFWVCTTCSVQKEKPIYLCKSCFKAYHTDCDDIYIFSKNEKKTNKYKKIIRKRKIQSKRDQPHIKREEPGMDVEVLTEKERNLIDLDQRCDEYFARLDELMEDKNFVSAGFYLQMLMNMSIMKTQEYLNVIVKKQPRGN